MSPATTFFGTQIGSFIPFLYGNCCYSTIIAEGESIVIVNDARFTFSKYSIDFNCKEEINIKTEEKGTL